MSTEVEVRVTAMRSSQFHIINLSFILLITSYIFYKFRVTRFWIRKYEFFSFILSILNLIFSSIYLFFSFLAFLFCNFFHRWNIWFINSILFFYYAAILPYPQTKPLVLFLTPISTQQQLSKHQYFRKINKGVNFGNPNLWRKIFHLLKNGRSHL